MRMVSLALLATDVVAETCVPEDGDTMGLLQRVADIDSKEAPVLRKTLALAATSHNLDSVTSGSRGSLSSEAANYKDAVEAYAPWKWKWNQKNSLSQNVYDNYDRYLFTSIFTVVLWMVLGILIWSGCEMGRRETSLPFSGDAVYTFQNERFGCFKTPRMCCYSFWCPGIQWADTMDIAGTLKFWVAFVVFFAAAVMNCLLLDGAACYGFFTMLLIVVFRQRLREQLGLTSWTCLGCCGDIFYVFLCPFCAITQEAQVVRLLRQAKVVTKTSSFVGKDEPGKDQPSKDELGNDEQSAGSSTTPRSATNSQAGQRSQERSPGSQTRPPTSGVRGH